MKKLLAIFLVGLLLLAGCSGNSTNDTNNNSGENGEAAKELAKLTIGTMPSIDKIPMIVAQEQGFFQKHGVDVEILNFQSPVNRDAALQGGELDGIMSDMLAHTLYLAGGMDLKMTSLIQTNFVVLASPKSGIKTFDDMKSTHTNGISLNGVVEYISDMAGASEKVLLPDVMSRVEQVVNNQLDLTIVPEPYGTMAVKRGAVKLGTAEDLNVYAAAMIFTADAIVNRSEAITAFYKGYEEAVQYLATADSEAYMATVIEKGEFSEEVTEVVAATEFISLTPLDQEQFDSVITWMNRKSSELNGPFDFDFKDVTDFSFLQ